MNAVQYMNAAQYDENYFERGVESRVSGYTNYHWRPEYSLPFAREIKKRLGLHSGEGDSDCVLDYGCAKGFLVKAFRLLNVEAYGYDISRYAIENADPAVRSFVFSETRVLKDQFRVIVSKDVLEHVPRTDIVHVAENLFNRLSYRGTLIVTVPLGENNQYRIREYELDKTHELREDEEWWINTFRSVGFFCHDFQYDFPGAKDHWLKVHPHGNGTFIFRKQGQ